MTIETITNDDAAFFDWLDAHNDGYFLNETQPGSFVLHLASCSHFDRSPAASWTRTRKLCSDSRAVLETWAQQQTGESPTRCQTCFS